MTPQEAEQKNCLVLGLELLPVFVERETRRAVSAVAAANGTQPGCGAETDVSSSLPAHARRTAHPTFMPWDAGRPSRRCGELIANSRRSPTASIFCCRSHRSTAVRRGVIFNATSTACTHVSLSTAAGRPGRAQTADCTKHRSIASRIRRSASCCATKWTNWIARSTCCWTSTRRVSCMAASSCMATSRIPCSLWPRRSSRRLPKGTKTKPSDQLDAAGVRDLCPAGNRVLAPAGCGSARPRLRCGTMSTD